MLTTLLYATVGSALVLILRLPMRRLFGATPAFTLWLLPPLLALLPSLPAAYSPWFDLPPLDVFPATQTMVAKITLSALSIDKGMLLWAVGCALCLLRLAHH